jgi:hypothetical protein
MAAQLSGNFAVEPHGAQDAAHPPVSFGPAFTAQSLLSSPRYRMLAFRERYAECKQHEHKIVDFEGNLRTPGPPTSIPMMSSAPAPFMMPLLQRYPRAQYPLAKLMNRAFTAFLFGDGHQPTFECPGDDDATDYANSLATMAHLWTKMTMARNWGGSCGTVGISWSFHAGLPRVEVHRAKHLFVHEWTDRQELVPAQVSEVYTYPVTLWNEAKRRFEEELFWYHRYWDEDRDILFEPCPVRREGKVIEPIWVPQEIAQHDDGETHFVWVQNIPSDEIDGLPDYEGQYDDLDDLDVVYSVLSRGTSLNLDPTLVLQMDPMLLVMSRTVAKGSDQALKVGKDGDAKYLELAGTSVTAGLALLQAKKEIILAAAQCILADPNEVAASGISSVAMKLLYAPMLAQTNVMRDQYGPAVERIVRQMLRSARKNWDQQAVLLPQRVKSAVDPETGNKTDTLHDRAPGTSEDCNAKWPPYFEATADDRSKEVTSLTTAVGAGKQIISTRTANEEAAKVYGRDPDQEWHRLQEEQQNEHQQAANAFSDADAGGRTTELTKSLPGDGELKISSTGQSDKPPLPSQAPSGGLPGAPGGPQASGGQPGIPGATGKLPGGGFGDVPALPRLKGPKLPK